jgi:hypothetical protein
MKNIRRVIFVLDSLQRENFEKFKSVLPELSNASLEKIWTYHPVRNAPPSNCPVDSQHASFIEPFLLMHYLRERGIPISFWYDISMCVVNDDLFRFTPDGPVKEDLHGTYIVTFRPWFWHPIFTILKIILRQQKGDLVKPNIQSMINNGCMNKFFAISQLYELRSKFIHDIAIPYNLKTDHHADFVELLRSTMGSLVVFKRDCIQVGEGLAFIDLDDEGIIGSIPALLANHRQLRKEVFVVPAHHIEREFRCYFTKRKRLKIYAIKERKNLKPLKSILKKDDFHLGTNFRSEWSSILPGTPGYALAEREARQMLDFLSYDTGVLEFALTKDGQTVLFEVNPMGAPLPFAGKDLALTNEFYKNMFGMLLGN